MRVLIALSFLTVGLAPSAFAAVRGPGKYNGVVIFDRWDGCHLFGGVYDMEVSEKVKELLRPYDGQAILVDAKEVLQPMNPGDGLITKLDVLGPAEEPNTKTGGNAPPLLDGLVLTATPNFRKGGHDEFMITLRNTGPAPRDIDMAPSGRPFSPRRAGTIVWSLWVHPLMGHPMPQRPGAAFRSFTPRALVLAVRETSRSAYACSWSQVWFFRSAGAWLSAKPLRFRFGSNSLPANMNSSLATEEQYMRRDSSPRIDSVLTLIPRGARTWWAMRSRRISTDPRRGSDPFAAKSN
jgi:hypothetical protein